REDARNDDPDADDMYPDHMLLRDGRRLEDVGEEEWAHHARPLVAADGVRAAARALGEAAAALDAAVAEARESDPPATSEQIGRAAGITRQSAHDRWASKVGE